MRGRIAFSTVQVRCVLKEPAGSSGSNTICAMRARRLKRHCYSNFNHKHYAAKSSESWLAKKTVQVFQIAAPNLNVFADAASATKSLPVDSSHQSTSIKPSKKRAFESTSEVDFNDVEPQAAFEPSADFDDEIYVTGSPGLLFHYNTFTTDTHRWLVIMLPDLRPIDSKSISYTVTECHTIDLTIPVPRLSPERAVAFANMCKQKNGVADTDNSITRLSRDSRPAQWCQRQSDCALTSRLTSRAWRLAAANWALSAMTIRIRLVAW